MAEPAPSEGQQQLYSQHQDTQLNPPGSHDMPDSDPAAAGHDGPAVALATVDGQNDGVTGNKQNAFTSTTTYTSSPPSGVSTGTQTPSRGTADAEQQTTTSSLSSVNGDEGSASDSALGEIPEPLILHDLDAETAIAKLRAQVEELTGQVTSLNGKLVQSYNRVGGLEDEVERSKLQSRDLDRKIVKLEEQRKEWEDKYEGGLLVEKDHVQKELSSMMDRVIEEIAHRGKAESDRLNIEQELESLSQQLFTEANTMVAEERVKRLRAERKMEELENNLKDTETMMTSQSEQMKGLGGQVDDLEKEREDLRQQIAHLEDELANGSAISLSESDLSVTSSAGTATFPDNSSQVLSLSLPGSAASVPAFVPGTPGGRQLALAPVTIAHPLQFLTYDIAPFQEFVVFTKSIARIRKNILTRPSYHDPGYGGYAGAYGAAYGGAHQHAVSQGTPGSQHHASSEGQQFHHHNKPSSYEVREAINSALPLSNYLSFAFLKRINEEDSEATLRLDSAPGLTFFSKRTLSTAIVDGNLVIEPAYTSIPSDKCCLCGCSLDKYIASHQSTAPKEETRKKLTRLATGWIPGTGANTSGTATPMERKGEQPMWSISALSDALQGALTPAKEASGFNFGSFGGPSSSSGNAPPSGPRRAPSMSGSRPISSAGPSRPGTSAGAGSRPERMSSTLSDSAGASATGNGAFILTAAAARNPQIYLFRATDSDSKYAVCPTYCHPRLRAVCELWTYIRTIEKGLLTEDHPRFYSASAKSDTSEYAQHIRKLSMNSSTSVTGGPAGVPRGASATGVVKSIVTPVITPGLGIGKQLGMTAGTGNGERQSAVGLGLEVDKKDFAYEQSANASSESLSSSKNSVTGASTGAGSPEDTPATSAPSTANASSDDLPGTVLPGTEASSSSRKGSVDLPAGALKEAGSDSPAQGDTPTSAQGDFKLTLPPTRPKRSVARPGGATPTSTPMTAAGSVDTFPTTTGNSEQTVSAPTASAAAEEKADELAPPRPAAPIDMKQPSPPPLPARSVSSSFGNPPQSPHSMGPPRLPNRPNLNRLSTGSAVTTPGPRSALSRRPSNDATGSNLLLPGVVSTTSQDWQVKCWHEVTRLREVVFWTRVGSNYSQH